jgi:hypothetical protein
MDIDEQLEQLIDTHGIDFLIDKLSEICHQKAEHLRSDWQDDSAANMWENNAHALENAYYEVTTGDTCVS